ncbi:MAG: dTDP-4-dehydrorhamnose reductase [Candidatus Falkowbacteria bacterium]
MKILIIGARGNLGVQLVKIFSSDHEIFDWDRSEIDITDREMVFEKVKELNPDVIINSAAYNAVDLCEDDEKHFELAKKLNGDAVGYLADASIAINAILIHYSSDYVFGGNKKEGYRENDKPNPISKYGETKLMGEQELIKREDNNLKFYLIRTSKLFGPKGESEVAPPPPRLRRTRKPSFFDIMLKMAEDRDEIDVVKEEMSCFTYTIDLAKATKKLVENNYKYGIYHVVNSSPCAWYDAAKELFSIANINIKVNPVSGDKFPRPAKRPKYSILLSTKFEHLRDYKEALKEYLNK